MADEPTLKRFLQAFAGCWFTAMCGPSTVPFAFLAIVVSQTWLKTVFGIMAALCVLISSYGVWAEERKYRNAAESKIKTLQWPTDRPKLSFFGCGKEENPAYGNVRAGFFLRNDGGPTLDIIIERFYLATQACIGSTVDRIESGGNGFCPAWMEDEPETFRWLLRERLHTIAEKKVRSGEASENQAYVVPISAVYRDFNNLWYRTKSALIYRYKTDRVEFMSPVQEPLGITRPW